ncbi:pp100 [Human betaherpesvirus 6A]|uniref:U11 protein n=1 Tax=Human betaherpesvirus 6A TaxID=32603 RepID=A0A0A7RSH7_9BETA|nr:pp100 [Human betaherpesvirus 6A]
MDLQRHPIPFAWLDRDKVEYLTNFLSNLERLDNVDLREHPHVTNSCVVREGEDVDDLKTLYNLLVLWLMYHYVLSKRKPDYDAIWQDITKLQSVVNEYLKSKGLNKGIFENMFTNKEKFESQFSDFNRALLCLGNSIKWGSNVAIDTPYVNLTAEDSSEIENNLQDAENNMLWYTVYNINDPWDENGYLITSINKLIYLGKLFLALTQSWSKLEKVAMSQIVITQNHLSGHLRRHDNFNIVYSHRVLQTPLTGQRVESFLKIITSDYDIIKSSLESHSASKAFSMSEIGPYSLMDFVPLHGDIPSNLTLPSMSIDTKKSSVDPARLKKSKSRSLDTFLRMQRQPKFLELDSVDNAGGKILIKEATLGGEEVKATTPASSVSLMSGVESPSSFTSTNLDLPLSSFTSTNLDLRDKSHGIYKIGPSGILDFNVKFPPNAQLNTNGVDLLQDKTSIGSPSSGITDVVNGLANLNLHQNKSEVLPPWSRNTAANADFLDPVHRFVPEQTGTPFVLNNSDVAGSEAKHTTYSTETGVSPRNVFLIKDLRGKDGFRKQKQSDIPKSLTKERNDKAIMHSREVTGDSGGATETVAARNSPALRKIKQANGFFPGLNKKNDRDVLRGGKGNSKDFLHFGGNAKKKEMSGKFNVDKEMTRNGQEPSRSLMGDARNAGDEQYIQAGLGQRVNNLLSQFTNLISLGEKGIEDILQNQRGTDLKLATENKSGRESEEANVEKILEASNPRDMFKDFRLQNDLDSVQSPFRLPDADLSRELDSASFKDALDLKLPGNGEQEIDLALEKVKAGETETSDFKVGQDGSFIPAQLMKVETPEEKDDIIEQMVLRIRQDGETDENTVSGPGVAESLDIEAKGESAIAS